MGNQPSDLVLLGRDNEKIRGILSIPAVTKATMKSCFKKKICLWFFHQCLPMIVSVFVPVYLTLRAIEEGNKDLVKKWLRFWIVTGLVSLPFLWVEKVTGNLYFKTLKISSLLGVLSLGST